MNYRLLGEGEKIQYGDEYYDPKKPHASAWTEVEHHQVGGDIVSSHYPHRRRVAAPQSTGPTTIRVEGWTGGAAPTARRLMECLQSGGLLAFECSVSVAGGSPHGEFGLGVTAAAYNRIVKKLGQCEKAHAEAMAASGSLVHAASHPGYEGVGTGGTPEAAVASCCTNGGQVVDQGVAFGHGRWWACVRRR